MKLSMHVLRSYFKLVCKYQLHNLPSTKVSAPKDHGENFMKVRPRLVRHLLNNRLFEIYLKEHISPAGQEC